MMRSFRTPKATARQGGWLGFIVVLLALGIVAVLATNALKQYGLVPGAAVSSKAGTPGERARAPGAVGADAVDLGAAPSPGGALERARGVEDMVKRQADERARRLDGAAK